MTTLVVGASGATGRQLVEQLIKMEQKVKAIVRFPDKLPESWKNNDRLSIIQASVLEISEDEITEYVKDCHAVASCLGHNLSLKGIYGEPRKLVTDSVHILCNAIKKNEPVSIGHRFVIGLIRLLLPPQVDNEKAADYLRTRIGQKDNFIEWTAVRPDNLVNEDKISEYEVHSSPIRSAIFNAGTTSRINVGHFMAKLITENNIWDKWKGQMPVVYNKITQNNS